MNLMASDLIDHLEHKSIMAHGPNWDDPQIGVLGDARELAGRIRRAEKFIFDSGSDQDPDTIAAVNETAAAMMEAGFFRLPHPIILIEDPFDGSDLKRMFYLCAEIDEQTLEVYFLESGDFPHIPRYLLYSYPVYLDTVHNVCGTETEGVGRPRPHYISKSNEVIYAIKKFIVTLNTENHQREKVVPTEPRGTARLLKKRNPSFAHTIIRIPDDETPARRHSGRGEVGVKRRKHLVRGFIWGKNTRPKEEQRWVKPYWRGDQEVGVIDRSHYVVEGRKNL